MKPRLSVILHYNWKRNIKISNLCKISIHVRSLARKIYNMYFYHNKLLDLKYQIDQKIWIWKKKISPKETTQPFQNRIYETTVRVININVIILKLKRIWPCNKPNEPLPRSLFAVKEKESHRRKILKHIMLSFDVSNLISIARFCAPVKFTLFHQTWITSYFFGVIFARKLSVKFFFALHNSSARSLKRG